MIDILRARRSVRQFTTQKIEQEKIDILNEAVLRSPSSRGKNPWEFIVVTDEQVLQEVGCAKRHGSAFVKNAGIAYVICADTEKTDVWVEDCSITGIVLQLTAESLGLSSCWAQIRKRPHDDDQSAEDYLKNLLGLPSQYAVEAVIGIGYADEEKVGHSKDSLQYEKLHQNTFA